MAWDAKDVNSQRLRFAIRASSGKESMASLCREFGISRPTGYLWRSRFEDCERMAEFQERSRRPQRSPDRTPANLEARVVFLRQQYPDWGAKKLTVLLEREGVLLPRITVHRILLRYGLVRVEDRHPAASKRFERGAPNELWQLDFKGMPLSRNECLPLAVLDDHSRFLVGLFETAGTEAKPVRQHLTTVFRCAGLPDAILMDHGTPWWNMKAEGGWTWLSIWLMQQGIRLHLSGYRHPQTQGKIERSNGSLEAAMFKRPKPPGQSWQQWLDAYRQEYNQIRPHEALHMDVPAQHWQPSPHPFQNEPRPWEYPDPRRVRTISQEGVVNFNGQQYFISRALVGQHVQIDLLEDRAVVWFCNTAVREFDLTTGTSYPIPYDAQPWPVQQNPPAKSGGSAPATPPPNPPKKT